MLSKKCAVCGKEFFPRKDKYEISKFCSIKCTIINRTTKVKINCSHFFNINNLVTLCADCHYKEHRQKKQQEINFD